MAAHSNITAEWLRSALSYNPLTGVFIWRVRTGPRVRKNMVAGGLNKHGYVDISLMGRKYIGHRLAFLYVTGEWPKGEVDHINGIRSDNRWENLRDVNRSHNAQNRRSASSNNSTGLLGVSKHGKHWRARIQLNGTMLNLGTFDSAEAAHTCYINNKRQLHVTCEI